MNRGFVCLMAGLSVALTATMAFAQIGTGPVIGIPPTGVPQELKTPPLQASDTITIPVGLHIPVPDPTGGVPPFVVAGWAGSIARIHVLDASEVDVDGLILPGGAGGTTTIPEPFGPRSENVQSVPRAFTNWHPLAQQSGVPMEPSFVNPLVGLGLHVKNSHPSGNSDIDLSVVGWNIWHLRDNPVGSTFIRLNPSDLIWVRSSIQDLQQLHNNNPGTPAFSHYQFPPSPPGFEDPNAHWLHVQQPATFHLFPGPGSQFFATMVGTLGIGIEHVPEPATGGLLALGIGCLGLSYWQRRRRKAS